MFCVTVLSGTYGRKWNKYTEKSKTQKYCRTYWGVWNSERDFPGDGISQGKNQQVGNSNTVIFISFCSF